MNEELPQYKDGKFVGEKVDALYGDVQIEINVEHGKIKNINVLEYPNDDEISERVGLEALTNLKKEVIKSQTSQVNIVSGATETSMGFIESLKSALQKAKN